MSDYDLAVRVKDIYDSVRHALLAEPSDHARSLAENPTRCPWTGARADAEIHSCVWCDLRGTLARADRSAALAILFDSLHEPAAAGDTAEGTT